MTPLYNLGPFRLDPSAGVLSRDGVPVALGARAVAVLSVLVARAGEFISKAEILGIAWQGMVVEEGNLAFQIVAIRRVLAQASDGADWIETLARRGYRFAGPVAKVEAAETMALSDTNTRSKRYNLPASLTSFIGREEELGHIRELLPHTRLLTLTGIGGIGKTRLALHAAREMAEAFRDGVWFIDLAPLTDPALVASAIAQVLGIQEAADKPLADTLARQLKGSILLLVLDNCEHLLEACARLAEALLGACADVTILATSREPLRIPGEQVYLIPALSLPDLAADVEVIARAEAVQLFVGRAHSHRTGMLLANRLHAVAKLCRSLDGIPLALELAAARTPSFTVEEIHTRLDDRFAFLTGGARTALPRQQTLRAALDWSYDLLTEEERMVLRHLSVFHGSFTLDAATAVAATDSIGQFAVADLISQLVARSLLVVDTTSSGARYHLLETPRAYAREKLEAAGETAVLGHRHAQYFCDYFERAPDDWLRLSDAAWRTAYAHECDNVRAALDWAFGTLGDKGIGIGLAGSSGPLWLELSLYTEGRRRTNTAITHFGANASEIDQARLHLWLGIILTTPAPAEAEVAIELATNLYRRLRDPAWLGSSLAQKGSTLWLMGRFDEAAAAYTEAQLLLEQTGASRALARYFEAFALLKMGIGELENSRTLLEKALALHRSGGTERDALRTLGNIANLTWSQGDLVASAAGFRETIVLLSSTRSDNKSISNHLDIALGATLGNLAGVLTEYGDIDAAHESMRDAIPLLVDAGYAWIFMDHFALCCALTGKNNCAALLAGFADAAHTAKKMFRQPNEARAHEKLHALLRAKLSGCELTRLLAEGAKLSEEEACRLALEE
jgi:predicted ATPase